MKQYLPRPERGGGQVLFIQGSWPGLLERLWFVAPFLLRHLHMAGPWLFVISRRAGISFNLKDGPVPVTAENFWNLVEDGRIVEDRYWGGKSGIKTHWNAVEVGDELFIYTGDDDLGIIGYATVSDKVERSNGRCLIPQFDRERCLMLRDHPVPAAVVREWRNLRPNVIDLGPFQDTLNPLLPWSRSPPPPKPGVEVRQGRG